MEGLDQEGAIAGHSASKRQHLTRLPCLQLEGSEAAALYEYFVANVPSVPAQPNADGDFLRTMRIFPMLYTDSRRSCGILEPAPLSGAMVVGFK